MEIVSNSNTNEFEGGVIANVDMSKSNTLSEDFEHVQNLSSTDPEALNIYIDKTRLTALSNNGAQEYLESLSKEPYAYYLLETPIIEPLPSEIKDKLRKLQSQEGLTNISVSDNAGGTCIVSKNSTVVDYVKCKTQLLEEEMQAQSLYINELKEGLNSGLSQKAPTDHASETGEYGSATEHNYGHTRLSDSVESEDDATSGKAATPKAVKTVNDKAKENEKDITNLKQSLVNRQSQLAAQLTNKGVAASGEETLAQLIPKVGNIQTDVPSDLFFYNVWQGSFPGKDGVGDVAGTIAMAFTIPAGQSIVTLSYAQTVDGGGYAGYNYSSRFRDLNYGGTLLRENSYPASTYPEIINYGGGAGRVRVYKFSSSVQRAVTIYLDSLGYYNRSYIATVSVVK